MEFIRKSNYRNIISKLKLLYALNITDFIFTIFLVGTGYFEEGNRLMISFVANPEMGFCLKVIIIGLIILLLGYIFKFATEKELGRINYIVNISLLMYIGINILHIVYLSIYLLRFR